MKTLFFILAFAGAFVALTVALNLPRERRLRRLAMSRAGGHDFAAVRDSLPEIPDEFVLDIYRAVQDLVPGKNVPLRADDDLWQTLEIDQGSLALLIQSRRRLARVDWLLEETGRRSTP